MPVGKDIIGTHYFMSPSRIARYFYHECDRFLLYHSISPQEREQQKIPKPPNNYNPVTQAMLDTGFAWEDQVVQSLGTQVHIAQEPTNTPLHKLQFEPPETLQFLDTIQPGEYLYQGTLETPRSFYEDYGLENANLLIPPCRPDLIKVEQTPEGDRLFSIIDVKASDTLKTAHKIQTIVYAMLLDHVCQANGIDGVVNLNQAGVWIYETKKPELFDIHLLLPHLENFLSEALPILLTSNPQKVGWHLHYRCEWCDYYDYCRQEAETTQNVSLIPYMTPRGRQHLAAENVNTLQDMAKLMQCADIEKKLEGCASLAGKEHRLRETTNALLDGTIHPFGGSSLALPVWENIRIFLTIQKDPVSGYIYAYALLNQEKGKNYNRQWIASSSKGDGQIRKAFILELYRLLKEVHDYNQEKEWNEQKSLQIYLFDSYDWTLMLEALIEGLKDPDIAEKTLTLLFHFYSADLLIAPEHPESGNINVVPFPAVVLTDSIRSLFALPIHVAHSLEKTLEVLSQACGKKLVYRANPYFSFRLSNAMRSDAIHAVWHDNKTERLTWINNELQNRLQATSMVLSCLRDVARQKDGSSFLFAWPPKFQFSTADTFNFPIFSKLCFLSRYESVLSYLDIRNQRTLPRTEREKAGFMVSLVYQGNDLFEMISVNDAAQRAIERFHSCILSEDSVAGEQAHMSFSDYSWGPFWKPPKKKAILFAEIDDYWTEPDGTMLLTLKQIKKGEHSPPFIKGKTYLLHAKFVDWNSDRIVKRIRQIDQAHQDQLVTLLTNPVQFCQKIEAFDSSSTLSDDNLAVGDAPGQYRVTLPPFPNPLDIAQQYGSTSSQLKAFQHFINHNLTLVWGPPGTGKTHFLALSLLCLLESYRQQQKNCRILVSGFTHAAIENCLQKLNDMQQTHQILNEKLQMIKLDSPRTHGCMNLPWFKKEECLMYLGKHPRCIMGATTYAMFKAFHKNSSETPFDLVVLDEGSQVRIPEALLVISRLHQKGRLLIAGDDMQLPPIIKGIYPEAAENEPQLHRSIFELLKQMDPAGTYTCLLEENFRMNQILCQHPAQRIYSKNYQPFNTDIGQRQIQLVDATVAEKKWVETILDPHYPLVVCVLEGIQAGAENLVEADLVADVTHSLRSRLLEKQEIFSDDPAGDLRFWQNGLFIVSPHHVQIQAIKKSLVSRNLRPPFFVDTVDKMQGKECEAVIVSYGVSDPEYAMTESEFIYSLNRLNVSITRARSKNIIFLPRPLLSPTIEALENPETAAGIAFMLGLEQYAKKGGAKSVFPLENDSNAKLVVYRRSL
ncbi:MAG: AAA family ATPase [SAR324 cluster bacterium]|nr:AAA family ATPase [SAR324 cluster bacterium]